MFVDIDYNRKPKTSKLHLAKPNKTIISNLHEKMNDSVNIKLGGINELNFSIPHYIDGEFNKHIEMTKEKMLIRLTIDTYKEWYIIDSIEEDGDDSEIFNVKAFSLPYELKGKRVPVFQEDAINAEEFLNKILKNTIWSIGEIDPIFNEMFRSFDITGSNVLESVIEAGKTYGALIQWDSANRKVSFVDLKKNGRFRGMTVNYGKLLQSIRRTRETDEMVTRLWVYGNEDLTIHSVNPTGQGYIEDFSYFMYPFERDSDKNVIKSSNFMSDELCHAILDHQISVEQYHPQIKAQQEILEERTTDLVILNSQLTQLQSELDIILSLLDIAQALEDASAISARKSERDAKQTEINGVEANISAVISEIEQIEATIKQLQDTMLYESNFTQELLDELNIYIIESEWRDDKYTDVKELYDDALVKFNEIRQPKVIIDATIDNILNVVEEQYYWDKLNLGDLVKVKYPQMNIEYTAKIVELNYDFENEEVSLVIANTTELLNDVEKLQQILYEGVSATTLIENNKYKWDKINAVEREVLSIITQEWDANKNKITAGVNNTIEVGNRGIIIKNPDFPDEVVIMQSGIIALSKDGGETWKTAIKPDGIVAERLIGQIIAGQELIITNSSGSFTFDNNGVQIDANAFVIRSGSGTNLRDVWNGTTDFIDAFIDDNIITPYEKKMMKIEWDRIETQYNSSVNRINGYYEDGGNSVPEIASYYQSYTNLFNYLFEELQTDGFPLLSDGNLDQSTRIDKSVYETRFKDFYDKKEKIDEIMVLIVKSLTQEALETADEAKRNIEEVMDDVVYSTRLFSTNGDKFTNGNINTTIYVEVYRGKENITATLPNSAFIWRKTNADGTPDTAWANAHVDIGSSIHIDKNDIDKKATFWCDIDIPE